jgi:hypothetical protein
VKVGFPTKERGGDSVTEVTTAQVLFTIALASIAVLIAGFALYVAGSTMWGDRWFRRR